MEFRRYNLLRQQQHRYEFLPSEFVALASYRAKTNHKRASRTTDRIIVGLVAVGAMYLTFHIGWWLVVR